MDEALVDLLWVPLEPLVYIGRAEFAAGLAEWTAERIEIDGRLAFIALTKGPEFHFSSLDTGAAVTPRLIRSLLAPILARHGFVTTRTPIEGADRQHRFNRAMGFRETGRDEFFTHYRLEPKCPS